MKTISSLAFFRSILPIHRIVIKISMVLPPTGHSSPITSTLNHHLGTNDPAKHHRFTSEDPKPP